MQAGAPGRIGLQWLSEQRTVSITMRQRVLFWIGLLQMALVCGCGDGGSDQSGAGTPGAGELAPPKKADRFQALLGRWLRPDGGYVLEVAEIDGDGVAKVGYFNPRPINVANARAVLEGEQLKLFVELRDTGYPGSTYTLVYNNEKNQLEGLYFQATMNETYEIVFVRTEQ